MVIDFCARLALSCVTSRSNDLDQVGIGEGLEDDDLVDAVEELGIEGALDLGP